MKEVKERAERLCWGSKSTLLVRRALGSSGWSVPDLLTHPKPGPRWALRVSPNQAVCFTVLSLAVSCWSCFLFQSAVWIPSNYCNYSFYLSPSGRRIPQQVERQLSKYKNELQLVQAFQLSNNNYFPPLRFALLLRNHPGTSEKRSSSMVLEIKPRTLLSK